MSFLDDFFDDIKEDLEKVKEEEPAPTITEERPNKRVRTSENESVEAKKPVEAKKLMMPAQMLRREVVSAAPTLNREYLQEMTGLPTKHFTAPALRPSSIMIPRTTPKPPSQVLSQPPEELVFQSANKNASSASHKSNETGASSSQQQQQQQQQQHGLFVGNLGPECRDDHLLKVFKDYPSVVAVKVVMEHADKCKGFGFVYFSDPFEMLRAMREKNGKLCGVRPMLINKAKGSKQDKQ